MVWSPRVLDDVKRNVATVMERKINKSDLQCRLKANLRHIVTDNLNHMIGFQRIGITLVLDDAPLVGL